MVLQEAGLSTSEEGVYRILVTLASATAREVSQRSDLGPGETEAVLSALERKGLASSVGGTPRRFTATPPDVALLPQLRQRADALEQARVAVGDLVETYRSNTRRRDAGQLIEVITGAEALRQNLRQVQDNARHELLWFCKAQYVAMPSGSNSAEFDALARGVRYRVLYEQAFFDDPGSVDNVAKAVIAGEVARAVPQLPLRLAVADRTVAVCPLVPGGPGGSQEEPTAALVRGSSLLDALVALFERYWETAVPLNVTESGAVSGTDGSANGASLSAADQHLLSLLVAGIADKAIASQLGLSKRTVQRRIQHLMTLAGAATRMQLAWQAARRGWM
ncbi:helix-turn-helix domain-containing protein [Streptomyces sp. NPDC020681]|uniref:helix-turn-helix domain-containing protein n=1 Tax=Streptomyces sp. NPDC020681 TaxID=3365083 RepID=UPI0037A531C2